MLEIHKPFAMRTWHMYGSDLHPFTVLHFYIWVWEVTDKPWSLTLFLLKAVMYVMVSFQTDIISRVGVVPWTAEQHQTGKFSVDRKVGLIPSTIYWGLVGPCHERCGWLLFCPITGGTKVVQVLICQYQWRSVHFRNM